MTLVLNSLGQLIQAQFGVNEMASVIVVGKAVGSIVTRKSEAAIFFPLQSEYGLFIHEIPKYLASVKFDRPGTILGDGQRRIHVENTLEGVKLNTLEGIATFIVLVLRHVEATADIVDYLEDLLKGKFPLIKRAASDDQGNRNLPFSLRAILQTFIAAVIDADADSPQTNQFRNASTKLVSAVGNAKFLTSVSKPSQHEQERFLYRLLSPSSSHRNDSTFHTLSADAAMIALASSANGAHVRVKCMTQENGEVVLSEHGNGHRGSGALIEVNLWLVQPPPDVAQQLRTLSHREDFEPRTNFTGMLPVLGGTAEVASIISQQLNCECSCEESLDFWKEGLIAGGSCTWKSRLESRNSRQTLVCYLDMELLLTEINMPPSLTILAGRHFKAPRGDSLHNLSKKAASILHKSLQYTDYEGFGTHRLESAIDFIIVAYFTGCIGKLASNMPERLKSYAWTADWRQFRGFAEAAVSQGLTINRLVLIAARIWGGLTPSFYPEINSSQIVMGIACPQTTILLNILSRPEELALHGLEKGLFTLHQGSIPLVPRDQFSGLMFAGDKRFRKPVKILDAGCQIPVEQPDEQRLIFTWNQLPHGNVILELNPYHTLCGLTARRTLSRRGLTSHPSTDAAILNNWMEVNVGHMGDRELLALTDSFTVRNGIMLVRTGTRADLQIAAAGNHAGSRTLMIITDEDASFIKGAQKIADGIPKVCRAVLQESGADVTDISDGAVVIFCRDDLPPHLGEISE